MWLNQISRESDDGGDITLAGFNSHGFDDKVLSRQWRATGLQPNNKVEDYLDVWKWAKDYQVERLGIRGPGTCTLERAAINILQRSDDFTTEHDGLEDAKITRKLYRCLLNNSGYPMPDGALMD